MVAIRLPNSVKRLTIFVKTSCACCSCLQKSCAVTNSSTCYAPWRFLLASLVSMKRIACPNGRITSALRISAYSTCFKANLESKRFWPWRQQRPSELKSRSVSHSTFLLKALFDARLLDRTCTWTRHWRRTDTLNSSSYWTQSHSQNSTRLLSTACCNERLTN